MTKEQLWFWLCASPDIFREDIKRLLSVYKTPEAVFEADKEEMFRNGLLTKTQKEGLLRQAKTGCFLENLEKLRAEGVRFVYADSESYPERLRQISDYPYGLFVKGELPDPLLPSAGMVGARACSEYGKSMTLKFAKALAESGVQIISGMAAGIDGFSAKGALSGGGKTFAVLGCGADVIYPPENFALYYEILASGGGIISEYPMGTPPIPWQFPARNRIISGLSDRLLVMEARERSGTLITVRYALDQGRDVFALPGRLTDKTSESCNRMIADGAGILLSPKQLLSEIFGEGREEGKKKRTGQRLSKAVRAVYELLDAEPVSLRQIMEKSGLDAAKTAAVLSELELSGLIREVGKNSYVKLFD